MQEGGLTWKPLEIWNCDEIDFPVCSSHVTAVGKNMYTNGRILKEERHMLSSDVRTPAMPLLNIFKGVGVD